MFAELEVFACVSEPTNVDFEVFSQWVHGKGEKAVTESRLPPNCNDSLLHSLTLQDTEDQFRTFETLILRFLECPSMQLTHLLCPMDRSLRTRLLEEYYSIDESVLREYLGNPLTGLRRTVDVVAEKTKFELKSCVRQLDNIRRIYDAVEDATLGEFGSMKSVCSIIQNMFQLEIESAWRYTCVLYLFRQRFQIQTSKKAFARVPADVFITMASAMLIHWTNASVDTVPTNALPEAWMKSTPLAFQTLSMKNMIPARPDDTSVLESVGGSAMESTEVVPTATRTSSFFAGTAGATPASTFLSLDDGFVANMKSLSTCRVLRSREERSRFAQCIIEVMASESKDEPAPVLSASVVVSILKGFRTLFTNLAQQQQRSLFEDIVDSVLDPLVECGYRPHLSKFFQALCIALYTPQFGRLMGGVAAAGESVAVMNRLDSGASMQSVTPFTTPFAVTQVLSLSHSWCKVAHVTHIVCSLLQKYV